MALSTRYDYFGILEPCLFLISNVVSQIWVLGGSERGWRGGSKGGGGLRTVADVELHTSSLPEHKVGMRTNVFKGFALAFPTLSRPNPILFVSLKESLVEKDSIFSI